MGNSLAQQFPLKQQIDLQDQSYAVPNSKREGWSEIRRSQFVKEGTLVDSFTAEVTTLYENFRFGSKQFPNNRCLGARTIIDNKASDFVWSSYRQVEERISHFGSGLLCKENPKIEKGSHIGIYSKNRPEWVIAEQACYSQSLIPISLYDTLGPEACAFIINQAQITTCIAEHSSIPKLLQAAKDCSCLKLIIQMEKEGDKSLQSKASELGITLMSFAEVEDRGAFYKHEDNPPSKDDPATIMYTSGTTGNPKGVILTHRNIVSMFSSIMATGLNIKSDDVHISYLPLAHILERAVQCVILACGGAIGFFQGEIPKLFDDILVLKPTLFISVPRLFNKLHDKAMATIEKDGGIKQTLFNMGLQSKKGSVEKGAEPVSYLWDNVVFSKFRQRLGGRVRIILTGSAPISKEIHQFLQVCFSCPVLQGYGLTETCAGGTLTLPLDFNTGNVGPPIPGCEIALQDVPELNYTTSGELQRGEVCIRGPCVFKGYYQDEEKTKECVDEDGWFHTGDIGQWNPNGTLSIIDRKKNIFKLSQGEYVAAEFVESVYVKNKFVEQVFIYGDSFQSALVAIIVPDKEVLLDWASKNGKGDKDINALCEDEDIKKMILKDSSTTARELKLKGFEIARAIHLEPELFNEERNLLTPTFKLKRPQLKQHYDPIIIKLYEVLAEEEKKMNEKSDN